MKYLSFLIISLLVFSSVYAATTRIEEYNRLRSSNLKNAMDGNVDILVIDLRDQKSFFKGRVKGSVNIAPKDITERNARRFAPDKGQYIVVYSYDREAEEGLEVVKKLESFGYNNVYLFENGYEEWDDRDYPIEKGQPKIKN